MLRYSHSRRPIFPQLTPPLPLVRGLFLIKYYHILFIISVFWLGCDRPSGLLFFVPALLLSTLTPLFLSSSVSLSYFILAVPMRECLGKHSCMSSPFPIAILNCTFFFRSVKSMNNWKRSAIIITIIIKNGRQCKAERE